jgi:threonine dehydrogenase-like Zn-dependent dehydrogenase
MAPFVVDEITLVGSRCGPFAPALSALARGDVDPRPLVAARYPLAEAVLAFEHAARPGTLKVLVDC